jgi:hypothetical protein
MTVKGTQHEKRIKTLNNATMVLHFVCATLVSPKPLFRLALHRESSTLIENSASHVCGSMIRYLAWPRMLKFVWITMRVYQENVFWRKNKLRQNKHFVYLEPHLAAFPHVPGTQNMPQNKSIKHVKAAPTCFEFFAVSWLLLFCLFV